MQLGGRNQRKEPYRAGDLDSDWQLDRISALKQPMAVQIALSYCKHFYNEFQILARTSDMKERVTVDDDITDTCVQEDSYVLGNLPEGLAKFRQWCG